MDVYAGTLTIPAILEQAGCFLKENLLFSHDGYRNWTGIRSSDYRSLHLSDASEWVLKYYASNKRYIHIFPARSGPHTFRVKANTLKSALLYIILSGKDFISEEEINNVRAFAGLSPVKELSESEAIFRMIEVLRS
jgi:hypothetical protein